MMAILRIFSREGSLPRGRAAKLTRDNRRVKHQRQEYAGNRSAVARTRRASGRFARSLASAVPKKPSFGIARNGRSQIALAGIPLSRGRLLATPIDRVT